MYYAIIKKGASFPVPVIGWDSDHSVSTFDPNTKETVVKTVPPTVPDEFQSVPLKEMTQEQWNSPDRYGTSKLVAEDGTLTEAPPPVIPLKTQASNALSQIQSEAYNTYGIFNEPVPQKVIDYIKSLMAIVKGTDTTSTSLPQKPELN